MGRFDATWFAGGLLVGALLASAPAALAQGEAALSPLPASGTTVERDLAGGEHHAWAVELAAGDHLRAVAEQRGIDLVVRLLAPGGEPIVEVDSPNGAHGPERLSFVAEHAGAYRLEVRSNYADDPPGRYALAVEALRPATADDRKLTAAEAAERRGILDDLVVRTAESRRRAVGSYRQALVLWQELGDERREAESWNHLAFLYSRLGEVGDEAEAFARHLELARRFGDEDETARSLLNLAAAYSKQGRLDDAEPLYRQALATFQRLGDRGREAAAWNALGSLDSQRGRLESALEAFERALAHYRALDDRRRLALTLNNTGRVLNYLGQPHAAAERLEEALRLARAAEEPAAISAALNNLGATFGYLGRYQEAIDLYRQARDLEVERGNRRGVAYALNNLGSIHNLLGKPQEALAYYRDTLEINRQTEDRTAEAKTLSNMGWTYERQGDPAAARPYYEQALQLARGHGDRGLETAMLLHLGRASRAQGDLAAATVRLTDGLALSRQLGYRGSEAQMLIELGGTLSEQGDHAAAIERLDAGRRLLDTLGNPISLSSAYFESARALRAAGELEAARRMIETALDFVEDARSAVGALDLRSSLLAERRGFQEEHVALLMTLHEREPPAGWDERAFAAAESGRARGLLDLLSESEIDVRQDADPRLLAAEREVVERLRAFELQRRELAEEEPGERLRAVEERLRRAREDARALEVQIRASSPRYATLAQPEPLTAAEVQGELLDAGTALLAFSLGEPSSFLWVVTRDGFDSYRLPPRDELESAARDLHERSSRPGGGGDAASSLGDTLLAPAAGKLAGRRLVVVADGALHYVPFAALGDPAAEVPGTPLIAGHEIVELPSVASLAVLRREAAERRRPAHTLAVFADPVFGADDPRVAAARRPASEEAAAGEEALRGEAAHDGFRRLRFSAREAAEIASLVPAEERLEAVGFAANRDAASSQQLADYRYVHFATHGVLDASFPELSGLVLSLVDETGAPRDGFLRLHDLYDLQLNADLVTLSACRTALGQEIRGEGLIGLTRGFMYAGAARVMASLWDVQDRATAEVMARFYRGMLVEGLAPAAALRQAQRSMRDEPRWSDPYYWAPFVLQGDWR